MLLSEFAIPGQETTSLYLRKKFNTRQRWQCCFSPEFNKRNFPWFIIIGKLDQDNGIYS